MLAEVYLCWAGYPVKDISKYTLAAMEAGEVIDSADYFGFGLLDDFIITNQYLPFTLPILLIRQRQ